MSQTKAQLIEGDSDQSIDLSSLVLHGSTSGTATLQATAIAGTETFTLPGTGGVLDRLNRTGNVLQVVNTVTGTYNSGIGTIPADNTKPQNTEGTEFMSLSITPTSSSSKLLIAVTAALSTSVSTNLLAALFQDSGADAISSKGVTTGGTYFESIEFLHYMTAGTTSSTTFKFRAGGNVGTTYFNGVGAAYFNGTMNSSITIWEIAA